MNIHHIALRTADLAKLEDFYVAVFQLKVLQRGQGPGGSVWLAVGGAILMLEHANAGEPTPAPGSMDLLAFAVGDGASTAPDWKRAWRARIALAGSRVDGETAHTLYFRDPDGRRLGCSAYPFR